MRIRGLQGSSAGTHWCALSVPACHFCIHTHLAKATGLTPSATMPIPAAKAKRSGGCWDICFLARYPTAEKQPTTGSQAYWVPWGGGSTSLGPCWYVCLCGRPWFHDPDASTTASWARARDLWHKASHGTCSGEAAALSPQRKTSLFLGKETPQGTLGDPPISTSASC